MEAQWSGCSHQHLGVPALRSGDFLVLVSQGQRMDWTSSSGSDYGPHPRQVSLTPAMHRLQSGRSMMQGTLGVGKEVQALPPLSWSHLHAVPTLGTEPVGNPSSHTQFTPCISSWKLKSAWRRQEMDILGTLTKRPELGAAGFLN